MSETLRKSGLNYEKLTRAKENTGEPKSNKFDWYLEGRCNFFQSGLCIYCTDRAKVIQA